VPGRFASRWTYLIRVPDGAIIAARLQVKGGSRDRKRFPATSLRARTPIRQIRAAFVIVALAPNRILFALNR
jgi:hypothetical protein